MTSIGVVLAIRNRLNHLVDYKTAPESKPGTFQEPVKSLISKLGEIQEVPATDNGDLYNEAVGLAYEVEDAVESFYLQQVEQQLHDDHRHHISSKTKQLTTKFMGGLTRSSSRSLEKSTSTTPADLQKLMTKIDNLSKRLGTGSREHDDATEIGCPSPHLNTRIIGQDENIKKLQKQLSDDHEQRTIMILGKGGIGKTTLARKLYELTKYKRAWVHVGMNFQARDIASSILQQLTSWECSNQEIQSMETAELLVRIHKTLCEKNYLVVLDDVWSIEAWEVIRYAFPSDKGARIIITSRADDIAQRVGNKHQMNLLNDEDTWELFKAQLLVTISKQMEEKGESDLRRKVAKITEGLPLVIIILGGMMRGLDLPKILQTLSALQNEESSLTRLLSLSYEHLPLQLKECFLYLGLFPEDRVVPFEKLYLMWMSDGLIPPRHTRMDTAQSYLNELVQRRLVMMTQKKDMAVGTTVESFELHDLVRGFCLDKGAERGFTGVAGLGKQKRSPILRITIDVDNHKTNPDPKHVRSLLFFETLGSQGESSERPVEVANLSEYRSARVLDFDGVNFRSRKLPKGIEKLAYLRYLGFRKCYLDELPSSYSKFTFLETLDLRVVTSCKMIIPNILRKFLCLLHLFFPLHYQGAETDKLKLDGLTRLETLVNFHAGVCDVKDLFCLENLRNFIGIADANNEDVTEMVKFISSRRPSLSQSSLSLRKFDCYSEERFEIFKQVLTTDFVQALDIEGHMGKLPSGIDWGKHIITEMIFNGSEFEEDPMPILGKLPCLTSLVLCNDAFLGNKMKITKVDFLKLILLKLSNLWALEELDVEDGAMSCLSTLELQKCRKLRSISPYLIEIETLQEVKITQMNDDFLKRLKPIPRAAKWLLTL